MPAATTHVIFALDVLESLPNPIKKEITNKQMFQMGSQGPDMLFFSNFSVLPGTLHPIGSKMHDEKIREVISYFEEHCSKDSDLRSYFDGYLCHFALDQNEHLLVNGLAHQESQKTGRTEGEIHFTIEGEYDIYMLSQKGKTWKDYDVYQSLKLSDMDVKKLAILYNGMIETVFDQTVSIPKLMDAIKQVYTVTRLLKPNKAKYHFVSYIESVFKAPKMISGMMLNPDKTPQHLNQNHKPWHPVFDQSITRTESFDDLYDVALKQAVQFIENLNIETDVTKNFEGEPITQ